eukprot:568456-Karenia_brevis.AAC.1
MPSGTTGHLDRSKTSGPGRKNRWRVFHVSTECYLCKATWLKEGYDLLQTEPFNYKRDYLMPVPGHDFLSSLKVQAKYPDLMRCTRAVLACMKKPVLLEPDVEHAGDGMRFRLADERLVPPEFN